MDAPSIESTISPFLSPLVQWGFAGLSAILLAGIYWLVKELLSIIKANGAIIAANTEATHSLSKSIEAMNSTNRNMLDNMLTRPCIAKMKVEDKQ